MSFITAPKNGLKTAKGNLPASLGQIAIKTDSYQSCNPSENAIIPSEHGTWGRDPVPMPSAESLPGAQQISQVCYCTELEMKTSLWKPFDCCPGLSRTVKRPSLGRKILHPQDKGLAATSSWGIAIFKEKNWSETPELKYSM